MQQEKELSGEESLKLIKDAIQEASGYFYETGLSALLIGFGVLVCSVLSFLMEKGIIALPFNPYYLMIPIFLVQMWMQFKEEKKKAAKTFTDSAIDYVWMGFTISVGVTLIACFANVGSGYIVISIILMLLGFASFLTGFIAKFTYQKFSAFTCWLLGVISFFIQTPTIYLLFAAAAVLIWIVPGFILNAYFKQQQHAGRTTTK